uniref:uncharacterized protein misp3 n=1 Tax=Doryrhamphus excisus TaxID=161450 RepID=UPI0025ADAADE|nr:uncharacterized protein misp3 [Doryrhamphus excisus]XP_057947573.1 uncharacterized protein misp3 [Doryrhamphus excisus]
MATVSLQKEEGPTDSLEAQESQMQGDANLSSSALDPKAPRTEPEEDTDDVFRDQTDEMLPELEQDSQHSQSNKEPDMNQTNQNAIQPPPCLSLDASQRQTYLEKEKMQSTTDEVNSNEYFISTQFRPNVQESSTCEESAPLADSSRSSFNTGPPRSIPSLVVQQETSHFADDIKEETNKACSKSADPTVDVVPSENQQGELIPEGLQGPTPKGSNQEAAQQVLGQTSAPLCEVAMELSNQGRAAYEGCVVTVREKKAGWVGERTQGESETGEQRNGGLGKNKSQVLIETLEEHLQGRISMESDSSDDSQSDSGLSADFSPRSTSNISTDSQAPPLKETPIDKEIRRAIEREQSLRRSRGMPHTSKEFVEIPVRKTIGDSIVSSNSDKFQGLDRQLANKMVQQEISEELRREQDLVKLGKVPGFYDKGTVRQLKEKKLIFEAFQTHSEPPLSVSGRSKASSWSSSSDSSTVDTHDDSSSQASTVKSSEMKQIIEDQKRDAYASSTTRGPGLSEGMSCQVIIVENNMTLSGQKLQRGVLEADNPSRVDSEASYVFPSSSEGHILEEEEMMSKRNPFFKLRTPTNVIKVEQDIREAQERERELRKQRVHLYGGEGGTARGGGGGGDLRRSLQVSVPDSSASPSKGGSGATGSRPAVGKLSMWPPGHDQKETINKPKTSHSSRQKTPLVHLWESGLVNGHNLDHQS